MKLAERSVRVLPDWAVGFLRDGCSDLQDRLGKLGGGRVPEAIEFDNMCRWNTLLVAAQDSPPPLLEDMEALQLLHARIIARTERGGVDDICLQMENLVRAVLVDQLQRQTDTVVNQLM